jgi:signal transduction histidine kinase/ligand-binding sensor domain-containing protein/AraC-like DNA-binding protein
MLLFYQRKCLLFGRISALLLLLFPFSLQGQKINENITFEHSPLSDGLPQTSVNTIVQDQVGFIWLGTHDGLIRYDGYEQRVFKGEPNNPNSLSNNQIMSLAVDKHGRIWIGTLGGGINILLPDRNKIINIQNSPDIFQKIRNNEIWKIYVDLFDNVWIGTSDGLFKAEIKEKDNNITQIRFREFSYKSNNDEHFWVRSIIQSSDHIYLIGTISGLYRLDIYENIIKPVNIPIVQYKMVTTICEGKYSDMWLGTIEDGIYHITFDKQQNKVIDIDDLASRGSKIYLPLKRIEQMIVDRFGNLWIASRQGLGKINLYTSDYTYYCNDMNDQTSLSDNRLGSVYEDRSGVIWIGTESKGVNRLDLYQKKFITIRQTSKVQNSLSDNYISAIAGKKNGRIWIASDGGGIDELQVSEDGDYKIIKPAWNNQLLNKNIISVFESDDENLWFGSTRNSIGKVNLKTGVVNYTYLFGYVFSIYEDSYDNIWFGTWGSGLYRLDKKTGEISNFKKIYNDSTSLGSDIVISIYEDNNRQLWIGTKGGGLCRLVSNNDDNPVRFESYINRFSDSSSLSHNDVYCILQSSKGDLWLGTGAGLNKMIVEHTPKGTKVYFKSFMEKDGLPNNIVYGILEDKEGNFWMSTNKGISKFNPNTLKFKNYDIHDGIQSNEFHLNAYFQDYKGRIYFGGNGGVTFFDPASIQSNPFIPNVIFTSLKIQGNEVKVGQQVNGRVVLEKDVNYSNRIVLNYKDKEITIEFSSSHYAIPEKTRFRYRLLGFNDNWQEISSKYRSITYTNLSQGEYVLQIMASNNDGIWPSRPKELIIKVLPPPWLTIWAFMGYIILFFLAVVLFKKYTLIGVNRKHQLVIDSLEKNNVEQISKMKINFFTNISHELRTPLTLISNPLHDLINNKKVDDFVKKELLVIQRNVDRLLQLVNQLLDFQKIDAGELKLKISQTNLIELLDEICQSFAQYAASRNINLNYIHKDEEIFLWLDREKIITVFFNLISNAFKYSPNNSNITVEIKRMLPKNENAESEVEIKVIDEGIGIEKEYLSHIFDRFYQIQDPSQKGKAGTGIGLSVSRDYIEAHGGSIKVESVPGQGSTFSVILPLQKEKLTDVIQIPNDQIINEIELNTSQLLNTLSATLDSNMNLADNSSRKSLLIIEDNNDLLHYLADRFSSKYHVFVANNGSKGLQLAIDKNPDIIITDIMMPEMDGLTLCKKLKNDLRTSHIPIIILTAKTTEESNLESLEAGADVFIQKPFNIEVLKAQVKSLLESREKLRLSISKNVILQPKEIVATSLDERFMMKLMEVIENNIANPDFGIKNLTDEMNMSHSVIFRKVKALTGSNVIEFIRSVRLKKAAQLLQKQKLPVSEVSIMVGFNDAKYFSKCFIKEFGVTPREYAKGSFPENTEQKSPDND